MTLPRALAILACLAALGCDQDPARAMKIIARPPAAAPAADSPPAASGSSGTAEVARPTEIVTAPPAAATSAGKAAAAPKPPPAEAWRPLGCPPPPETSPGPSSLVVTGPCAFQHRAAVSCEALFDDFLLTMTRPAGHGATLMVFINVEKYRGPGSYKGAQMFLGLQDKANIYRWSSDTVDITVGSGEEFAVLPKTSLEAEPLLVECSGPMTNYQCSGRGDMAAMENTIQEVAGTLRCEPRGKEK